MTGFSSVSLKSLVLSGIVIAFAGSMAGAVAGALPPSPVAPASLSEAPFPPPESNRAVVISAPPPSLSVAGRPIDGRWDVEISCPDLSTLRETVADFSGGRFGRAFDDRQGLAGQTELSMAFVTDDDVRIGGYVTFGGSRYYRIEAAGHRADATSFAGIGQYGHAVGCRFFATQQ